MSKRKSKVIVSMGRMMPHGGFHLEISQVFKDRHQNPHCRTIVSVKLTDEEMGRFIGTQEFELEADATLFNVSGGREEDDALKAGKDKPMTMKFENIKEALAQTRIEAYAIRFGDYDQRTDTNGALRLAESFEDLDEKITELFRQAEGYTADRGCIFAGGNLMRDWKSPEDETALETRKS